MIPGEIITQPGEIELNAGKETITIEVSNTGGSPDSDWLSLPLL
nr:urease subunit beta [Pleurocapsa sp. CCALA 161]